MLSFARADFVVFGGDPVEGDLGERVVHHRIKGTPVEPVLSAVPDFTDDVGIRVDRLHEVAPLDPEGKWYFVRNVEPPAVDAVGRITVAVWIHPSAGDVHDVLACCLACQSTCLVLGKDREFAEPSPALVLEWLPRGHIKPVGIGRCLAVGLDVPEGRVSSADMIEDAIDDDTEALGLGEFQKVQEGPIALCEGPRIRVEQVLVCFGVLVVQPATIVLINVHKVRGVVLVVTFRLKDRIEVEGVDAEFFQVVEPFAQSYKITAEEA